MSYEQAKNLLTKYRDGNCSDDEKAIVEKWLFQYHDDEIDLTEDKLAEISREIWSSLPQPARTTSIWLRIAAAASVLLFLAAGAYFLIVNNHKNSEQLIAKTNFKDIDPGGNKAVLTLSNGKTIVLTNAKNGVLASQHNTAITKTADGQVIYTEDQKTSATAEVSYNTMSTPRGGKYALTLADGTKVMLDAASSIKYPVTFNGAERRVEITGQVYFEVVHNAAKPFRVIAKGQTIEDLGTHFNINAYDDEPVMKITLAEGSVKVGEGKNITYLKPGQQAIITPGNPSVNVQPADMEETFAWTNGKIVFHDESLQSIMRRVCRWYNVDVVYQNNAADMSFGGSVSRNKKISSILNSFHKAGDIDIDFKITGQTVTIIKK